MHQVAMAGAVLCGGRSTRMGSDKATIMVDGATLLDRARSRLATVAAPVLIASGTHTIDGLECVLDPVPGAGPLAGIVAALGASPRELLAVVAVDMPDMDTGLLLRLAAMHDTCLDAVVPRSDRGLEPLHAVYSRSALPLLDGCLQRGEWAVRTALTHLRVNDVDARGEPAFARNLNEAADLTAWRATRECAPPRH